jgi:iron complex outermembrane receptor protein
VREEVPTSAPEHPHGVVSLEAASANRGLTAGAYGTAGFGRLAVRGEGSVRDTRDLRTPVGDLLNTASRTYNLSGGAALTGDWGHAGASYRFYDSHYGLPGGFIGSHPEGVGIDMRRHMVRADAERHVGLGPFSSVHANASFTHYEHEEHEDAHEEHEGHEPGDEIGTTFGQDLAAMDVVARHDTLGRFTQGAFGVRAQWRDIVTGGSLRTPNTRDYTLAAYLVEELALGPVRVQGGVRYDWSRYEPQQQAFVTVGDERIPALPRDFGAFSGSVGVLWPARDWFTVGASVARAYRTPDFNELYSDGPHLAANSYDVGDPRLGTETGVGLDAFARVRTGRLQAEVSAFRNTLSDYIYLRNTGEIGRQGGRYVFQYSNTDAELTGAEGQLQWSLTSRWVVDGTVSYVQGRVTGARGTLPADPELGLPERPASEHLPFIPPLNGRVGLRYETPRWFAGSSVRMAGRQERLGDFETPTAGYGVLDLNAGVRLPLGGRLHSLTLRADNVLDKEYREHLARTKEIMPQAGVNVSLLYRLMF